MKNKKIQLLIYCFSLLAFSFLFSCNTNNKKESKIKTIEQKQVYYMQKGNQCPSCSITMNYSYLEQNSKNDTVSNIINKEIANEILGTEYRDLSPETAIDSFKNSYIADYKKEVVPLYLEDIKNNKTDNSIDVSQWYNYTYELKTSIKSGKKDILNYEAQFYEYTGGAHPNSWSKWLNFDSKTGELITLNKVFIDGSQKAINKLLLRELMNFISKQEGKEVNSVAALNELGILDNVQMYIPDNFALEEDKISFLYNSYDIAPYAQGAIKLSLHYSELDKYLYK